MGYFHVFSSSPLFLSPLRYSEPSSRRVGDHYRRFHLETIQARCHRSSQGVDGGLIRVFLFAFRPNLLTLWQRRRGRTYSLIPGVRRKSKASRCIALLSSYSDFESSLKVTAEMLFNPVLVWYLHSWIFIYIHQASSSVVQPPNLTVAMQHGMFLLNQALGSSVLRQRADVRLALPGRLPDLLWHRQGNGKIAIYILLSNR